MINFFKQLIKDKNGNYSLREVVIILFVICTITSWAAQQFFGITAPEYMFYSFVSVIAAGCFGYSLERNVKPFEPFVDNNNNADKPPKKITGDRITDDKI